uniref:Ycf54 n=1 Tax=Acrosorium ciliolatum TaxID=1550622 RepID=A0A1Z1M289_9FLOR|nr:hypothetical protein [Acrosorium ciliolatum]ARW59913.1 hypothetical protein [Acrosorium ciliolatum]
MYNYYFALASQNFLLNEEPLEEILRERTEYYQSSKKDIDFWFVINPNFVHSSYIEGFNTDLFNSYAAIISLDKYFIQWLKLRIGFIAVGNFKSESLFILNN